MPDLFTKYWRAKIFSGFEKNRNNIFNWKMEITLFLKTIVNLTTKNLFFASISQNMFDSFAK